MQQNCRAQVCVDEKGDHNLKAALGDFTKYVAQRPQTDGHVYLALVCLV